MAREPRQIRFRLLPNGIRLCGNQHISPAGLADFLTSGLSSLITDHGSGAEMTRKHGLSFGLTASATFSFALMAASHPATAGPSSPIQVTEQRNAAVGFAITSWMTNVDVLEKHCSALGSKSDGQFVKTLDGWEKRNNPYVNAAMEYMADIEDGIRSGKGEASRQDFRNARKAEFVNSTHKAEAVWFPDGKVDEQSCQHMASFIANGSLDLDKHKEFFPVLQDLKIRMAKEHGER
jgi:hypothetical protein